MKTLKNYVRPSELRKKLAQLGIKTTIVYYNEEGWVRKPYKLIFKNGLFILWVDATSDRTSWQFAFYYALPSYSDSADKDMIVEDTNLDTVLAKFGQHLAKRSQEFARIAEALK